MLNIIKINRTCLKNKVFVPYGEEDGIFNKSGISEFVSNAGFAMGTYAAFATELLVDAAITATAGAGVETFAATGARMAAKTGAKQGVKHLDDFFKGIFKAGHMDDFAKITTKTAGEVDNMAKAGNSFTNMTKAGKARIADSFDAMTLNMRNVIKSKSAQEFFLNAAKGVPVLGSGIRQG